MRDIKLFNDDIAMTNGDFDMIGDPDELRQTVYIGLQTNQGEWFLNPDVGIDFSVFEQKNPDEEEIRAEIQRGLMQEERIESVSIDIEYDGNGRELRVRFTATAGDGEQEVIINA